MQLRQKAHTQTNINKSVIVVLIGSDVWYFLFWFSIWLLVEQQRGRLSNHTLYIIIPMSIDSTKIFESCKCTHTHKHTRKLTMQTVIGLCTAYKMCKTKIETIARKRERGQSPTIKYQLLCMYRVYTSLSLSHSPLNFRMLCVHYVSVAIRRSRVRVYLCVCVRVCLVVVNIELVCTIWPLETDNCSHT